MKSGKGRNILINMKSSVLSIFFMLSIACWLIVEGKKECTCGGLGQGTNPCSCSEVVVKAAKLPKPTYYVSPQKIKDAATSKSTTAVQSSTSHCGCSNSKSSSESSSTAYSSNSKSLSNSSPYTGSGNSNGKGKGNKSPYSYRDLNAQKENSIMHNNRSSPSSSKSSGVSKFDVSQSNNSNDSKQNIESLDVSDSTDAGNVVPRFPPVGDLCYPSSHNEKMIEKSAKVTPAHPGKIVYCNPSVPYETCINARNEESNSRSILSGSFDETSLLNSKIYETIKSGPFSELSTAYSDSAPATHIRPQADSYGKFIRSKLGIPKLSSYSSYANLNMQNGRKQYSKAIMGSNSADCFDDMTGEIQDHSYPAVPADAVSLTLAYRNLRTPNVIYRKGKQFIPEDKLSFGHRTMPTDAKRENKEIDIAEEKLVTLNKPIVELKLTPPKTVVVGSYDDYEEAKLAELEAIERESITQQESVDHIADRLITYKDLGYAPIKASYENSKMYEGIVKGDVIHDSAEEPCGPLGPPIPDYMPGKVILNHQIMGDTLHSSAESSESIRFLDSKPCPF